MQFNICYKKYGIETLNWALGREKKIVEEFMK